MKYFLPIVSVLFFLVCNCTMSDDSSDSPEKSDECVEEIKTLESPKCSLHIKKDSVIGISGEYNIDILRITDSSWNAYYFDHDNPIATFYDYQDGFLMFKPNCFQTCGDIIRFDSLFNPLIKLRFENKTLSSYGDKQLTFLSYYENNEEVVIANVSRNYKIKYDAWIKDIEKILALIQMNELQEINFSNKDFLLRKPGYWITTVDQCFGFYTHPKGEVNVNQSLSDSSSYEY